MGFQEHTLREVKTYENKKIFILHIFVPCYKRASSHLGTGGEKPASGFMETVPEDEKKFDVWPRMDLTRARHKLGKGGGYTM